MYFRSFLIFYIFISNFFLVLSFDLNGDVSISPARIFLKKKIFGSSIRPHIISEKNFDDKLNKTKSISKPTTPITKIKPTSNEDYYNEISYETDNNQNSFSFNYPDLDQKIKPNIDTATFEVSTYKTSSSEEEDSNIFSDRIDKDENPIYLENHIAKNMIGENYRSSYSKNSRDTYNFKDKKIKYVNSLNKPTYKTVIIDVQDRSKINDEAYPIVKFFNQYKCDINITTCGLYNDPQLEEMFYLEEIRDVYNRQRCFVADADTARKSNKFGARLITQYFHTFGMLNACFEIKYFANGPGAQKMEIAQQDNETNVIWSMQNSRDYEFEADLSFKKIKSLKLPISLRKSEPRFFITVNLDPNQIGRIGILGFNFTYSKCEEL